MNRRLITSAGNLKKGAAGPGEAPAGGIDGAGTDGGGTDEAEGDPSTRSWTGGGAIAWQRRRPPKVRS